MKSIELYCEALGQYSTSKSMNSDVSGTYVQKTDYDELRTEHYDRRAKLQDLEKENAELKLALGIAASFPIKVRMECRKRIKMGLVSNFVEMLRDSANRALSKTPTQHLADIKADAVIRFAEFLRYSHEGAMSADSIEDTADEYANKLRDESK